MCANGLVYVVLGFQLNYIASPEKGVVAHFLVIACLGYKKTSLLSETFLGVTCFMTTVTAVACLITRAVRKYKHLLVFY